MSDALPRRIEAEDLQVGDVFEYELDTHTYEEKPRFHRSGWKTEVRRDTVRGNRRYHGRLIPPVQIAENGRIFADHTTCPGTEMGGWFTPEEAAALDPKTWHVLSMEESQSLWFPQEGKVYAEPGQLFKPAVLLATAVGENNHGYVWLKPKQVVVLIERSAS